MLATVVFGDWGAAYDVSCGCEAGPALLVDCHDIVVIVLALGRQRLCVNGRRFLYVEEKLVVVC